MWLPRVGEVYALDALVDVLYELRDGSLVAGDAVHALRREERREEGRRGGAESVIR